MDSIQFKINQIPCELVRLKNGYMLLAENEEKIILLSHEIYFWLSGHVEVVVGLSVTESILEDPEIQQVLQFVGIDSTKYL